MSSPISASFVKSDFFFPDGYSKVKLHPGKGHLQISAMQSIITLRAIGRKIQAMAPNDEQGALLLRLRRFHSKGIKIELLKTGKIA
jgi:hypothetical protein